jgi:Ca2+-binding EF-hand superfamily protein
MQSRKLTTAITTVLALGLVSVAGIARADDAKDYDKFVQMCDSNKDGMVSKEEFMKIVEKKWSKMDTKKVGKMDSKQFEQFLKELMKSGA